MEKHWLITGGCGFIGKNLVANLLKRDDARVSVVDDLSVGNATDLPAYESFARYETTDTDAFLGDQNHRFRLLVADIRDSATMLNACADTDVIVHLAANTGVGPSVEDPESDCQTNVIGTFNMLEAARQNGVGRVVFASSGAPLGEVLPPIHEELAPHPVSPYGASKLAGEGYCSAYYRTFGLHTVVLRFGNVYGPGSSHKSSVIAKFLKRAISGCELEIYGDGNQTRDFVYIDDLTNAICLAAESDGVAGETFQIATNSETTVEEITQLIREQIEFHGRGPVKIVYGEKRKGDVTRNFSDISKARSVLGWHPTYSLNGGLEKTLEYFLADEKNL